MSLRSDTNHEVPRPPDRHGSLTPALFIAAMAVLATLPALLWREQRVPVPDVAAATVNAGVLVSRLNPNTATAVELTAIPGLGPTLAGRIVEYREAHRDPSGARAPVYRRAEDLDAVRGIGPKTVDKLRRWLTFGD